jgi:dihydroorotate dehydrogenase electron transfer subunit
MTAHDSSCDAHHSTPHFADGCHFATVMVSANDRLSRDTYRLRVEFPELARRIVPGQFVMVRLAGLNDPLLGRPLALYDTVLNSAGEATGVEVVYRVMGKATGRLSQYLAGQSVELWGPLGNAFSPAATEHLIMVAGGIGHTPFMALAKEFLGVRQYGSRRVERADRVTLCYGERSAEYFAAVDAFRGTGLDVRLSSDDGSVGHHGRVTDLLRQVLDENGNRGRVVCCGPEVMMEAVAHVAAERSVPCQVSLETPMACGLGICFSCVAKVRQPDGTWDYKRTCVEGPIFDAAMVEF